MLFCCQVLGLWHDQLDASFTVKQFVEEVRLWERKGFVEPGIWTDLKHYLQPHLLPTGFISSIHRLEMLLSLFNDNKNGSFSIEKSVLH